MQSPLPTTRASRNAGSVKQSRPALRKARNVVGNFNRDTLT